MSKTDRERREQRREVNVEGRLRNHKTGFDRTTLKIPEGLGLFQLKRPGTYRFDIIPFTTGEGNPFCKPGQLYYERTFFVHRDIGANKDAYVCPRKTAGKTCPICSYRASLADDPNADEELIKSLSPKERQLFLIYNYAEPDKGIQLWDVSFHLFGKLLDTRLRNLDEDEKQFKRFANPDDGCTLKITAEEKSLGGNTFCEVVDIQFKLRSKALDPDLVESAPCLDNMPIILSTEKLKAIFLQKDEDGADDEDGDEDDAPPPKKKKPPVEDDEDGDEDDAPPPKKKKPPVEDDEDGDEDDAPPPKKKKAPPVDVEDDDEDEVPVPKKKKPPVEDDEDGDDFDDEPAPKKKLPDAPPPKKKKPPVEDDEDDDIPF